MDNMAEVVGCHKDKEMALKQDRDYIDACIAKDDQAQLGDINKKHMDKKKHQAVKNILDQQVREKQMRQDGENRANRSFMNRWSEAIEKDDKNRVEMENMRK